MEEWQHTIHTNCNAFHEIDIVSNRVQVLGQGGWRIAWRYTNDVIMKTIRRDNQNFDTMTYEKHKVDAIIAEHVASSKYIVNIYGFFGQSVLNESASRTLQSLMRESKEKPLTPSEKLRLSLDIATGLANLHDMSGSGNATFVHTDLKPANIVVAGRRAKLNDFNAGKLLKWNQTSQAHCGFRKNPRTSKYLAPEQTREGELLTEKIDVFALGSILLYILTGREPFHGERRSASVEWLQENISPPLSVQYRNASEPSLLAIVEAIDACHEPEASKRISAKQVSSMLRKRFDELNP